MPFRFGTLLIITLGFVVLLVFGLHQVGTITEAGRNYLLAALVFTALGYGVLRLLQNVSENHVTGQDAAGRRGSGGPG